MLLPHQLHIYQTLIIFHPSPNYIYTLQDDRYPLTFELLMNPLL